MSDGEVRLDIGGEVARITFDRPEARNAMTWRMYEQLAVACETIRADPSIRVATLRGAGGRAFVAGTDIAQFLTFESGEHGVAYERRMEAFLAGVDSLSIPTLAIVDGWCVGGGLAIAAVCDLRIATPTARFGVPIARTIGNCLSLGNVTRLVAECGLARTKQMLIAGEMLSAEDMRASGFVATVAEGEAFEDCVEKLIDRLRRNAPLTMQVTKEGVRRILQGPEQEDDDLLRICYGSQDFRRGVRDFIEKREPQWTGT